MMYYYRYIKKDMMEYARFLTSYIHLINDNNDLKRLKSIVAELKDIDVLVCFANKCLINILLYREEREKS